MKIAILSDIHSNLEALEAAFDDLQNQETDFIYCTGDLVGYAASPNEVINLLLQNKVRCLYGNHDHACNHQATYDDMVRSARLAIDYTRRVLSSEYLNLLKDLPVYLIENGIYLIHGLPPYSFDEYLDTQTRFELTTSFSSFQERVAFVGHTHLIQIFELTEHGTIQEPAFAGNTFKLSANSRYIISAGSVGQPRDDNREAGYLIYDTDNDLIIKREIQYNVDSTIEKIKAAGLPLANGSRLLKPQYRSL
jgi:predicted phosphodiesterase